MTIEQLIDITQNRLNYLTHLINEYIRIGDIDNIALYQKQHQETIETLEKLKLLSSKQ